MKITKKLVKKILGYSILVGIGVAVIVIGGVEILIAVGVMTVLAALILLAKWLIYGED